MNPAISQALVQVALPLAFVALCFATTKALMHAGAYFKAKKEHAVAGSLQAREFAALEALANCAADAVQVVENTMRPMVKDVSADGKISPEEGAKLKAAAVEIAKAQAQAALPKVLEAAGLGDLDALLGHLVESAASRMAGDSRAAMAPAKAPDANP